MSVGAATDGTTPHVFLGEGHGGAERRTLLVVGVCAVAMGVEIAGGLLFNSVALLADGLHMSTHAGALGLAAIAYRMARRRADDPRFSFGTGKLGDLAGFTSAVALALIAMLIGVDAIGRLIAPTPIRFGEAIPIAVFGLVVNVASAAILGGFGGHAHHGPAGAHARDHAGAHVHDHAGAHARDHAGAHVHDHVHRDNNLRAAIVHVAADAAVSVAVIVGLVLARLFDLLWMDPLAGLLGAAAIAWWSWNLLRASGAILLDMRADPAIEATIRDRADALGDRVTDLHVWRLGPGHLGAIVSLRTRSGRDAGDWRARLGDLDGVSHLTVEILPERAATVEHA